ncbi:unnamed protein product, partial [Closterium sp. NIES-53]
RVPLPSPPASSLPESPDPESDSLRAASPTATRFLATAITDPLFESTAASALVAELVDFAAAYRLDYATSLVAESASASVYPPSVGVRGDPDAPHIPTPRSYAEAIEGPYSSQWQAAMDAEMTSWKSTGTYVVEVPPPGANIVSGMCIFRVKRPPGSPPVFKARYVARGFSQRQGVDFFHTFSPTPKMTTLWVLLHIAAQRDYELHSLDFSTAFLQGSLHEEMWLRRPPGFTVSFPAGTQWSLQRPVYGLRQAPREWHDTLRTTLAALGFAPSTSDPSLFLHTDTTLPPFYVLVYVDDLVFATADTEALAHVKSELQKRHTCTDLSELTSYLGLRITRDRAQRTITLTQSHMVQQVLQRFGFTTSGMGLVLGGWARVGYTFSLGSGSVSWRSTRSSSVLNSNCEAEIYAGAMAAQELRWLTYLLTDLGEAPRSPPVLYVDNKAMLALYQEHILEHRTKHIALRYFLTRGLQQRGQLHLAYVASQANNADNFTKALQPCDHLRFCTVLGLLALPFLTGLVTSCSPPLCLWGSFVSGFLPGTAPTEALHTFTLNSGASRCFIRDSTTITPLSAPVLVRLGDPSGGPVLARSSTVLPFPAVPSGSLSGLHLPSFSTNLVSSVALLDAMVTTTTPGGQRVSICTSTRMGRHLAMFTHSPGSSLYTLATEPPHVVASAQVSASGLVAPPCSCRLLSHQTLLWHHHLGHPSLPRLRGMHSRLLVSGLPRSLPPLPPSPAPPCLPCVEGRQHATPQSSSFPPTSAPLQSLHMDVWGPARVSGQGRERYFLLVVDDYTRYTTVFPLCSKGEVPDVLIP